MSFSFQAFISWSLWLTAACPPAGRVTLNRPVQTAVVREDELRRVPWEISPPDDKLMLILSVRKEKIGVFL